MLRKASALLTKASREVRGENRAPDTRLGSRGTVRTRAKRYRRNRTTLLTRRFPRDFIRNLFLALGRASTFRARQLLTRLSSPTASRSRPFRRQAAKATSEYAELYVPGVTSGKILPKRIKSSCRHCFHIRLTGNISRKTKGLATILISLITPA